MPLGLTRAQEAERLLRQVLAFRQRIFGDAALQTATAKYPLGRVLRSSGRPEQALLREAVAVHGAA